MPCFKNSLLMFYLYSITIIENNITVFFYISNSVNCLNCGLTRSSGKYFFTGMVDFLKVPAASILKIQL